VLQQADHAAGGRARHYVNLRVSRLLSLAFGGGRMSWRTFELPCRRELSNLMAKKRPTLEDFQKLLHEIARALMAEVECEQKGKPWTRAYMDVRGSVTGTSRLKKFRIDLPDGSVIDTLNPPHETTQLLYKVWRIKGKVFADKWYGIKVVIYPDGKCETEFNYDSECANGLEFFDT
jgi:hypothetical protein